MSPIRPFMVNLVKIQSPIRSHNSDMREHSVRCLFGVTDAPPKTLLLNLVSQRVPAQHAIIS